jgi:triphosphatase
MEIELKLVSNNDALLLFETKVLPSLVKQGIQIERNQAHLYNEYFDTPDAFFGQRKMGFRVRSRNQKYEQTVKTKGQVEGGLHQRPEYNVDLDSARPDLSKFDPRIWGETFDVKAVNEQLEGLFTTHFERTTFELTSKDFALELAFDLGEVKRGQDSLPICEIELELVRGESTALFDIAQQLVTFIPCRLSNVTKAARGYLLLHGRISDVMHLPAFLPLSANDTCDQAFCKTVQIALNHWQHHQLVYSQTSNHKALKEMYESILLLLQGVVLYLPILQCKVLVNLHKQLLKLAQVWAWQEQLESIYQLRSKKGPFSRKIPRNQNLMNYLMGRREGLLNAHKPNDLSMSALSTGVQLAASRLLVDKPWRSETAGSDIKVQKYAKSWLSQTWQSVQQSLPKNTSMDKKQYLAIDDLLQQSLINGFLLAGLFVDSRGQFRAPWLDLATGIKELKCLKLLHDALNDIDIEGKADYSHWIEDKTHSVIHVMEQTREVAMDADTYW